MKKILISLMAILMAVGLVGGGAFAYFSDVETSEDNVFTAGTLDLTVDDQDDPNVVHIELDDIKPGWESPLKDPYPLWKAEGWPYYWTLKNVGSIPGKVSVEFSAITNDDNGCTEPEEDAEESQYGVGNATCGGDPDGELGQYLKVWMIVCDGWANPFYQVQGVSLDSLGGNTYEPGPPCVLGPGEKVHVRLQLKLPPATGNIVQSDSVEFDMIFHLDQVP